LERCIQVVQSRKVLTSESKKQSINIKTFRPLDLQTQNQYLYGIIQGGTYEDLRKKSAEFVVAQNTPGVAIGGVSVGETKEEMRNQVKWVASYLPLDRPVHLLGVGQVDDIVDLVKHGIDTFDCVEPTRVARMGTAYQTAAVMAHLDGTYSPYEIDVNKAVYKGDLAPLDENCSCSTCVNYSKAYLHHLFKQRELLGYTLLSYHNIYVMERLMEKIRKKIEIGLI
jgi:tRNA-guanine transglycosylase